MSLFWLFSYGTLRQAEVQQAVFGRVLETQEDSLVGFELGSVTITDPFVIEKSGSNRHPILMRTDSGKAIAGSALSVNAEDLDAADRYEAADYERVQVALASGRQAFVYVQRDMVGE